MQFGRYKGEPVKKPTGFMSNGPKILQALSKKCSGAHGNGARGNSEGGNSVGGNAAASATTSARRDSRASHLSQTALTRLSVVAASDRTMQNEAGDRYPTHKLHPLSRRLCRLAEGCLPTSCRSGAFARSSCSAHRTMLHRSRCVRNVFGGCASAAASGGISM